MSIAAVQFSRGNRIVTETKKTVLADKVPVNSVFNPKTGLAEGRHTARLIREADPNGAVTEHQMVLTGRVVDALFGDRAINQIQHQAATRLRDLYERSGLAMGETQASDPRRTLVSGNQRDWVQSEDSWRNYKRAMKQTGQWWRTLRAIVIEDQTPEQFGHRYRCHGITQLQSALDALARHFGMMEGRRLT
jgi:hypothetical protein